ncbi:MAG: Anti-anti-sigma regulatory factor [Ignavibacteria bacterium]|nr:Anti-anti-sigma regulatory factor [Ignavibacteria bacterium]
MSQFKLEEYPQANILYLSGQFTGDDDTEAMRKQINEISKQTNENLIIDMSGVSFFNSTAIGVIVSCHAHYIKTNGKLCICNASQAIENIFDITRVSQVINLYPTTEEALKKIAEH